jgi:Flp pilus assembly protein TadD
MGQNAEALLELDEAVNLFPHDAGAHLNFAVPLCVVGQFDRAEQESSLALYLDPASNSAQEIVRILADGKAKQARH